jgi:hypothetical protein
VISHDISHDIPHDISLGGAFTIGPFSVDAAGGLSPRTPDTPPAFVFRWRDRVLHASLLQTNPVDGRLTMRASLGRVPSTARSEDGRLRPQSFDLLRRIPATLPRGWRVLLLADHRVLLETEAAVTLPITATALMTEITSFLLALAPYLDLLEEAGVTAPAGPDPVPDADEAPGTAPDSAPDSEGMLNA